jgi:hypothetical protein
VQSAEPFFQGDQGERMISAEEFKKQMREIAPPPCPQGGCCVCPLNLQAKVGIVLLDGTIDVTFCMSLLAAHLDREWKKWDEKHPPKVQEPIIDAEVEQIKIHMKAPQ